MKPTLPLLPRTLIIDGRALRNNLLVEALESAYAEGARSALLEVRSGNETAQEMYRKFGFEVVGRRERYYKDNNEDADFDDIISFAR